MQQKYPSLGVTGRGAPMHPDKAFGLIVGKPDSGKSHLIHSNPTGYVFNFDMSSAVGDTQATLWPSRAPDGRPTDSSGVSISFSWDACKRQAQEFIRMMEAGEAVPTTVYADSLGGMIDLLRHDIVARAGKSDWRELDGRRAWDTLYDEIIEFGLQFRNRGIGFYYTCHVVEEFLSLDDEKNVRNISLTITPNFFKRLYWRFELVVALMAKWDQKEVHGEGKTVTVGDKQVTLPGKVTFEKSRSHVLTAAAEELEGITKCRDPLPDLVLPPIGTWEAFTAAYQAASPS